MAVWYALAGNTKFRPRNAIAYIVARGNDEVLRQNPKYFLVPLTRRDDAAKPTADRNTSENGFAPRTGCMRSEASPTLPDRPQRHRLASGLCVPTLTALDTT